MQPVSRLHRTKPSAICHCSVWYALIIAHPLQFVNNKNSIFQCLLKLHNRTPWNNICILHIAQKYWIITVIWYGLWVAHSLYTIIGDKKRFVKSRYDPEQSNLVLICRGYLQDLASDLVKRIAEIWLAYFTGCNVSVIQFYFIW